MSEQSTAGGGSRREQIEDLLAEYDGWRAVLDRDADEYGLIAKTVALYRFAIANQDCEGATFLNEALAVFAAAEAKG
ncbi:hypothetical protein G6027_04560 [Dietzia sp. SLG310A2-38A2]|uniref:hypothetical protein n=1 Tax=Dietzia sp. SLG310A2-38A2 TaxID=1630643 RepID=UPI0015FD8267|nr:hypothetical protein [Dietzia sp. SLG310A2-38A2]MBB1030172.1 hypothetical protein [Dietzia sp. SLG310A2-38A2]